MKKLICAGLGIVMLFSMVACSSDKDASSEEGIENIETFDRVIDSDVLERMSNPVDFEGKLKEKYGVDFTLYDDAARGFTSDSVLLKSPEGMICSAYWDYETESLTDDYVSLYCGKMLSDELGTMLKDKGIETYVYSQIYSFEEGLGLSLKEYLKPRADEDMSIDCSTSIRMYFDQSKMRGLDIDSILSCVNELSSKYDAVFYVEMAFVPDLSKVDTFEDWHNDTGEEYYAGGYFVSEKGISEADAESLSVYIDSTITEKVGDDSILDTDIVLQEESSVEENIQEGSQSEEVYSDGDIIYDGGEFEVQAEDITGESSYSAEDVYVEGD